MAWVAIGLKILPLIIGAIQSVEHLLSGLHGKDKQDAAIDMISAFLIATEGATGRDLLNDNDVRAAARSAIDAVVALQNVIATRAGKPNV